MRPCFLSSGLYIPSICNHTSSVPVFDFDSIQFAASETDSDKEPSPRVSFIPCEDDVFGCCYAEELDRLVVACGGNTHDHRLCVFRSFCPVCR